MERKRIVIMKLGGSVITSKSEPRKANLEVMDKISKAISESKPSWGFVLVHGGGSFGHYEAKKYGLGRKSSPTHPEGVSRTRDAMLELNLIVTRSLESHFLHPYPIPPLAIIRGEEALPTAKGLLNALISKGMTPVTFGDVLPRKDGFFILSGDIIMRELCRTLRPELAVMVLNVDGLYRDPSKPSSLIEEMDPWKVPKVSFGSVGDATGGMRLKLHAALSMAKMGAEVRFVNGLFPERLSKVLKGEKALGTVIRRGERSER